VNPTRSLAGTVVLVRLVLRRDRVRLPIWLLLLAAVPTVTASSFAGLFPTEAARAAYATGEMAFDTYSRLGGRLTRLMPVLRRTGARLDWGIDDPRSLERQVPGMRLLSALGAFDAADPADLVHTSRAFRLGHAVFGRLPALRDIGHIARYAFG